MPQRNIRSPFREPTMSKGGHNPENTSDARPAPPKGSGVFPRDLAEPFNAEQQVWLPEYRYYGIVPIGSDGKLQIYDGDTIKVAIDVGMEQWVGAVYYRLYGIQAPELRPLVTREAGTAAKEHLCDLIQKYAVWEATGGGFPGNGCGIIVRTHKRLRPKDDYRPREVRGKFGRWLIELIGQDSDTHKQVNINQLMIADGHAEPYTP